MRTLTLDASERKIPLDFYESILAVLEAPHWHGTSVNALIDSMIYGGINGVDPPYKIWIKGAANLPPEIKTELRWLAKDLERHGVSEMGVTMLIDA